MSEQQSLSDTPQSPAEKRARKKFGDGFESLDDKIKDILIRQEQELMELEPLAEKERERQAYREQKKREAAFTRSQLAEFGVAERVAYDWNPRKMNAIEEDSIDISCGFSENELEPVSYANGHVVGFRRSTIEAMVPHMQDIWARANAHDDVQRSATGYMMFHLWTSSMHRDGTKVIHITDDWERDLNNLFEAESELIKSVEDGEARYSYVYNDVNISHMHLFFSASYYPEPKSVKNWGIGIKPIEKRSAFDIFTASDPNVPCAVQVARRLWGDDVEQYDLEGIIVRAGSALCIVKPHSSVHTLKEINDYSDLVVVSRSPIKSLSVIDQSVIYLLYFNDHVGLLENVKNQRRNQYYTSFRPIQKYPNTEKVTMCFDIECYFDPDKDQRHVPYLCCACVVYDDVPGNVMEFEGRDCVAQMIDYAAENVAKFGLDAIELIAHNGGGYDFHYILSSMYDPGAVKNILIRNNTFISFQFTHMDVKFSVKDSLNFLLCSLSKAAKAFLVDENGEVEMDKTDFPYHEARSEEDLQRTFQKWISVKEIVNVNVEKEKIVVTSDHYINYKEDGESRKLIDWSKEYCCNDVIVLAKVWVKFKQTVHDVFFCQIVDQTYTLAGLSFRLFEAHLPPKIKLYHPSKTDFINMRESLIGGRCISLNGMYKNVICVDVKSLYPTAMAFYDQPYGPYKKVTKEVPSELGIYYCTVEPYGLLTASQRSVREAGGQNGFFPLRKEDGSVVYRLSNNPNRVYRAWYTSVDMQIGREEGHKIEPIVFDTCAQCAQQNMHTCVHGNVGYSWRNKGKIFKDYIQDVLYKLKLKYEECGDSEKRQVIKIIMNSLWGKFAQKWMDTQYHIRDEITAFTMDSNECYKIWDTDWFIVKSKQSNKKIASKPVQNGVFVLSWARHHMKLLWDSLILPSSAFPSGTSNETASGHTLRSNVGEAAVKMLYSDTDSIMVKRSMINENATFDLNGKKIPVIGNEMGQLEIEAIFDQLICVGKKQYIGSYRVYNKNSDHPQIEYKKRFKGVPLEYIKPEMYMHLLKCPNNKVQIDFLKFKREWGSVHGYIESKTVTAT